jgi:L-serine kinase (ADP)
VGETAWIVLGRHVRRIEPHETWKMDALSDETKFVIESESFGLELEIARLDSLSLHERTLPHEEEKLLREFKNLVTFENPIIVDRQNIVLDGNHRTYVLKRLGFNCIPVCRIDYLHRNAKLKYWFRLLGNVRDPGLLKKVVGDLRGTLEEVADRNALENRLAGKCSCFGIQQGGFFAVVGFSEDVVTDAVSAYDMLERIQDRLLEEGMKVDYIPCRYLQEKSFCDCLKGEEVVLWTPQITKEMVVHAAVKKQLFAPKSTRHLIPARPIHVNVPALWLKEDVSLEDLKRRFVQFLQHKEMQHLPPGQVVKGRYYEEELFVFVDPPIPVT